MNKQQFLINLQKALTGFPQDEINERIAFYSEMIDDRVEEGLLEEDAIEEIGSVNEVISQIINDIPIIKLVKEKVTSKKYMKLWEIILLILGSPIWLSLAIALFAVIISIYIILWSVIISLWAVFASLIGTGLGCVIAGIIFAAYGNALTGLALIGAGLVCTGLSIFTFYGNKIMSKGIFILTKKIIIWIKNRLIRKGEL